MRSSSVATTGVIERMTCATVDVLDHRPSADIRESFTRET
jgi:hypothetical protein